MKMIERRKQEICPKCKSRIKAIMHNNIVCVGIGCDYIYRTNVLNFRTDDKTFVDLKTEFNG